jgi:hypothetical protein
MIRINVWSSPRNVSTAFMYAFAQRPDTTVVDEPLYAHYLSKTQTEAVHPGREEVLAHMENDGEKVVRDVILGNFPTKIVLFKQMTHHLIELDWEFLLKTKNVLLIRNPREIIASYAKVIPNPSMPDIGVHQQFELFQFLQKHDRLTAVVDAKELLLNPKHVLRQLCERIGIPFNKEMLAWNPGPRPEDGIWAKYWYANVHQSSGFEKYEAKETKLSFNLRALAKQCEPFYAALYLHALKAF